MLIAKGANVNELDHYQSAPIHCASLHGHKLIIDELVANGSDCSLKGKLSAKLCLYLSYFMDNEPIDILNF